MIPIVQPTLTDFENVMAEFRQAWQSGQVTTGIFTRKFEQAVEEKLKVPHAVMVQSCTAGMMLVLKALELQGEVILPAFTWTSTAHAVVWNGLIPVFADIQPGTYTLDPMAAAQAITPRTVAIMPVNVFGLPPDYQAFEQLGRTRGLRVIYDSAQGLGSQARGPDGLWRYAGNFGDAEIFSMSPTKVVSAMEGGLITTGNGELAGKLRQMRDYGKSPDGDIAFLGLSARVPEVNAIVARHNFSRVDDLVSRRRELIQAYKSALGDLKCLSYQLIPENYLSSGNYFTIFINPQKAPRSRNEVYEYLSRSGIQSKKYFYPALHFQKVYQEIGRPYQGRLPVTEAAAASGLALPLFTHMPEETLFAVSQALKDILQ